MHVLHFQHTLPHFSQNREAKICLMWKVNDYTFAFNCRPTCILDFLFEPEQSQNSVTCLLSLYSYLIFSFFYKISSAFKGFSLISFALNSFRCLLSPVSVLQLLYNLIILILLHQISFSFISSFACAPFSPSSTTALPSLLLNSTSIMLT